jgi:hypothetical protein
MATRWGKLRQILVGLTLTCTLLICGGCGVFGVLGGGVSLETRRGMAKVTVGDYDLALRTRDYIYDPHIIGRGTPTPARRCLSLISSISAADQLELNLYDCKP